MATPNERGSQFESRVAQLLNGLREKFPALVTIEHPCVLELRTGREVKPDFRLTVRELHQTNTRLIECQSRDATDHALADKIGAIRRDSDYNRFIFVYENRPSDAVMAEFKQHGVVVYSLPEFEAFIADYARTLAAVLPVMFAPLAGHPVAASDRTPQSAPPPPAHHREERGLPPGIVTTKVISPPSHGGGFPRGGFGGGFRTK